MSQPRKATHRKLSTSSSSSSDTTRQLNLKGLNPLTESSQGRPIYPRVPKRPQVASSTYQHESMMSSVTTESRIFFSDSPPVITINDEYESRVSPSNQNNHTRRNLDFITKYTKSQDPIVLSFEASHQQSLSPQAHRATYCSTSQPDSEWKKKRSLSPLNESDGQISDSKRSKSFVIEVEDDEDADISQLLDHRRSKLTSSQIIRTIISTGNINESFSQQSVTRKPTARKLSTSQRQPASRSPPISFSQPIFSGVDNDHDSLVIELDDDLDINNQTHTSTESSKQSNDPPQSTTQSSITRTSLDVSLKKNLSNGVDHSPSNSSPSFLFDTPRSSLSRTTTNQTTSTPPSVIKHDAETQMTNMPDTELMKRFIEQSTLKMSVTPTSIDFDPVELSKQLFEQCQLLRTDRVPKKLKTITEKQYLHVGRYEIEVLSPLDNNQFSTMFVCDICLKHFYDSSIAFQRHTSKCLSVGPPGEIVFTQGDLAIFQIDQTEMNSEQRIYTKFLSRLARLFLDSNRIVEETKVDRFAYFILCRRDAILSQTQSCVYRFIGYFSKPIAPDNCQSMINFSSLFLLPPFATRTDYNQLLIRWSYFLMQSKVSETVHCSSPSRPLNKASLSMFESCCRDTILAYLNEIHRSSSITLETLARQTLIHPRDLLLTLYFNRFILSHPTEKDSVYLVNLQQHSTDQSSLIDLNVFKTKKIITDKTNFDHRFDQIILD